MDKNGIEANDTKTSLKVRLGMSLAAFLVLALGAGQVWYRLSREEQTAMPLDTKQPAPTERIDTPTAMDDGPYELTDSRESLWAREQPGRPISLRYAPPGVQAIVHVRLANLATHPEGEKIIRSLGPDLRSMLSAWLNRIGVDRTSLDVVDLYLLPQGTTLPRVVAVCTLASGRTTASLPSFATVDERRMSKMGTGLFWFPSDSTQTFVFGPSDVVATLPDAGTPDLRRELMQLLVATHDTDLVTILANPNFLRDEASGLFPDSRRRLLDELYSFWSDEAQAISIGLQVNDVALAEVRMIAREDLPVRQFAANVRQQLDSAHARIGDFLDAIDLDRHWQPLAHRFPAMVRFVTEQSRVAVEGNQVAVAVAIPAEAVHNLLLASELSLASPVRPTMQSETDHQSEWTIDDVLASNTSVRFDQKSLEFAMQLVVQQTQDELPELPFEFTIEIIGSDLELEGITRNQQIRGFDESNRPLSAVLTALVMKANPFQAVTKASDVNQKLVWVPSPNEPSEILITTRSAAETKGLTLPAAFQE